MAGREIAIPGIVVALLALVVLGCGKHYWVKLDATAADFVRDSRECAEEAYTDDHYKSCLQARGYERQERMSRPEHGWRGLSDEGKLPRNAKAYWTNYPKPLDQ